MKVRIETTLILSEEEVAAALVAYQEFGEEDETFREYIKSSAEAAAHYWQQNTWANYAGYNE